MVDRDSLQQTSSFRASRSGIKRKRPVVSCSSCRKRKAKCDRKQPCSACDKRGESELCDFGSSPSHRKLDIRRQLAQMEASVQSLLDANRHVDALQEIDPGDLVVAAQSSSLCEPESHVKSLNLSSLKGLMSDLHDIRKKLESFETPVVDSVVLSEPDLLFGSLAPITAQDVASILPSRQATDRIIAAYFNAKYLAVPFIHAHQFRRQYETFWKSPTSCNLLWISILFSVLGIGSMVTATKNSFPASTHDCLDAKAYISLSARYLVSGRYHSSEAFSVEALVLHVHSRYISGGDTISMLSSLSGLIVRLAQTHGYYRDLGHQPATATPFEVEMRRRVWFMIQYYDLLFAFEGGVPPLVHQDFFDTDHPTNLSDDDFDEDSIYLTPRPTSDPQPVLACIYQSRLFPILRRIARHACVPHLSTTANVLSMCNDLEKWRASIPPCLQVRAIRDTSFTDSTHVVMNRVMLELMYNMSLSALYRPFLEPNCNQTMLYDSSLDICRQMAVKSLDIYVQVHQEMKIGGRLHEERYLSPSMRLHDFLIAVMILPLSAAGCPTMPPERGKRIGGMLCTAYDIWTSRENKSPFLLSVSALFEALMNQVKGMAKAREQAIARNEVRNIESQGLIGFERPTSQLLGNLYTQLNADLSASRSICQGQGIWNWLENDPHHESLNQTTADQSIVDQIWSDMTS